MKSFKTETKTFMKKLLKEDTFDNFLVRDLELVSFAKFEIKGPVLWEELKPIILYVIKGREVPKSLKVIFVLDKEKTLELHENAANFSLNLNFTGEVFLTGGTSAKTFTLDKTLDYIWESYIIGFFKENKIYLEEL